MAKPKARTLQQRFGFLDDDLKTPKHDEIMFWLDENSTEIIEALFECSDWSETVVDIFENRALKAVEQLKEEVQRSIDRNKELDYDSLTHLKKAISNGEHRLSELNRFSSLGDPPKKQQLQTLRTIWEHPIVSENYKSSYTIGFVDFVHVYNEQTLMVKNLDFSPERFAPSGDKVPASYALVDGLLPEWHIDYSVINVFFEVKSTIPSFGELIRQVKMYQQHVNGLWVIVSPDDRFANAFPKEGIHFYKYS